MLLTNVFVDHVGQNFRWSASMEDVNRDTAFINLSCENICKFDDK